MTTLIRIAALVVATVLFNSSAFAQPLIGSTGTAAGDRWQTSWLDIKPSISFKKGDTLILKLEGDAENVLVRLLPVGSQPESSDGIEGDVRKIPANRSLIVILQRDHPNVRQISVHAGKEAWGRPLGGNNGSIRVISIDRSITK